MKKVFESQKPQSLEAIQNERIRQIIQEYCNNFDKDVSNQPQKDQLQINY